MIVQGQRNAKCLDPVKKGGYRQLWERQLSCNLQVNKKTGQVWRLTEGGRSEVCLVVHPLFAQTSRWKAKINESHVQHTR